jgi:hypothetical protein
MAVIQSGTSGTTLLTVDPTFAAGHVTIRPPEILGAYQMGLVSGAYAGAAAGSTAFSFRWAPATSTNLCMVRRVEVGFATVTAFTTAQAATFSIQVARQWTANDTGGTSAAFTQTNTAKLRTTMPTSGFATGGQIMISNTGAITAGTRTLDTQAMGFVTGSSTAIGTSLTPQAVFQQQPGDYPLIFAANEGFILNNVITLGAAGVLNLYVNVEWFELAATSGSPIAY